MKSLKNAFSAAALAVALASSASADPFVFVDGHLQGTAFPDGYVLLQSWGDNTYTNTWDISAQEGFASDLTFDSATASFWFSDDPFADGDEFVSIDLGSILNWMGGVEVDGNFGTYHLVSGNLSLSLLADIAEDGRLTYQVRIDSGDTYLKETQLVVHAHVPEAGSTLALLGLACIGLAVVARRKQAKL